MGKACGQAVAGAASTVSHVYIVGACGQSSEQVAAVAIGNGCRNKRAAAVVEVNGDVGDAGFASVM